MDKLEKAALVAMADYKHFLEHPDDPIYANARAQPDPSQTLYFYKVEKEFLHKGVGVLLARSLNDGRYEIHFFRGQGELPYLDEFFPTLQQAETSALAQIDNGIAQAIKEYWDMEYAIDVEDEDEYDEEGNFKP
jgi:hypothetical protein